MRGRALSALVVPWLAMTGCYYGSLLGARTLSENEITVTGGVGLPAYLSSEDRRDADASGEDDIPVSPSATLLTGAARGIDLGIAAYGYGVGPLVRVALLNPSRPEALSLTAGANYVIPARVVGARGGLAAGYLLSDGLEVYGGWEGGWGPDVINIPQDSSGGKDWSGVQDGFFHGVRAGACLALAAPDSDPWIPGNLTFEFALPLGLRWNTVLVGLGVTF